MVATFDTAIEHHRAGRHNDAITLCKAILAHTPRDLTVLNLLGVSLFSAGQGDAAVDLLAAIVQIWPDNAETLANYAVMLQTRGDADAAILRLRQLAVLEPDSDLAYGRLGTLVQDKGDLDGSMRYLIRANQLSPNSEQERNNLGVACIHAGDYPRAIVEFRRAIALNPAGVLPYLQLGEVSLRLGQLPQAITAFQRALILEQDSVSALNGLSRCRHYLIASVAAATPSVPTGLVVRGPFSTASGYSHMSRRFLQTLRERGISMQGIGVFGNETWPGAGLEAPIRAKAALNFLIPLAVERIPRLTTVAFTMFEGTTIPPAWKRQSEHSDLIIVPCEASRIAWAARGFPEDRLHICPLGVDPEPAAMTAALPAMAARDGRPISSYGHRFLNISDFVPRKNIDGLMRVWLRCTNADDDAVLVLKLGKGNSAKTRAGIEALARQSEAAIGKRLSEAAPVVLVEHSLDEAEMTGLFRSCNYYWSMSHGEGWDLPMSKAGAMGLGLIAPSHSAYVDYLDTKVARMIPARTTPALLRGNQDSWSASFFGLDWWDPDEDAAAAILTAIISGRDDHLPDARHHLLSRFTWGQATDKLLTILGDAGLMT